MRLPGTLRPTHYDLHIRPNWRTPGGPVGYQGKVEIHLDVVDPSAQDLVLHSIGAEILAAHLCLLETGKMIRPTEITHDDSELLRMKFAEPFASPKAILSISYKAEFCDVAGRGMKGIFRTKRIDGGYNCLTFLAPTYARNAFPCWDEPELKATFSLSLIVRADLLAAANMPMISEDAVEGEIDLVIKKFAKSPKMSTYLVSFHFGKFDLLEEDGEGANDIPLRVFTPSGKKRQGRFALNVARKALKFLGQYFSIPYPLPKLDLAAFGDFPCGAMEDWGLISFRDSFLLVDENESSFETKISVGQVVCHEISHSWFGNLVTMKWWTDLWLNEGFATFMQVLCYEEIQEEKGGVDIWDSFQAKVVCLAKSLDSLESSHPIQAEIKSESDVDEMFDDISYKKGASVIAMLHDYLGDAAFRSGMSNYLNKFSYSNAETVDLWAELEHDGRDVKKFMETWIKQKGYPLITVKSFEDQTLTISCELFRTENKKAEENINQGWYVPLSFLSPQDEKHSVMLFVEHGKTATIKLPFKDAEFFKMNVKGIGFYRVCYPSDWIRKLGELVEKKVLGSQDRMTLLDDFFALTNAGHNSTQSLIDFMDFYSGEDNYFVCLRVGIIISKLQQIYLDNSSKLKDLNELGRKMFSRNAKRLGWVSKDSDSPLDVLLRSLALRKMVEYGDPAYVSEAAQRFGSHIPADLRVAVYQSVIIQDDTVDGVNKLLEVFRKTDLLEEKLRILASLQVVRCPDAQTFLLDFALSSDVRNQDAVTVMNTLSRASIGGRKLVWNFFKTHKDKFRKQFTGLFIIGDLVQGITENFASPEMEAEVKYFFEENTFRGTRMPVAQALESIRINAAWIERLKNGDKSQ